MYDLKREDITDDIVVIKINQSYHAGISAEELYDVTRGCWRNRLEYVAPAKYALASYFGEVKEVYEIDRWMPAEKMVRKYFPYNPKTDAGRIAFEGELAPEEIRKKYIGKSTKKLCSNTNPVRVFKAC